MIFNRTVQALVVVWILLMASSVEAATITLQWDRNADPTVQGYVVSYGTQSGVFTTTANVGNQASWTVVLTPAATTTYFFAVQAYNAVGTSGYSAQVSTVVVTAQPKLTIDAPAAGSIHRPNLLISGWAIDTSSTAGPGVDTLHVWAYPNPGSGAAAIFLGVASYGALRPDVGAAFGDARYSNSGYTLPVVGLTPGVWQITVFAHSTVSGDFALARSTTITVSAAPPMTGEEATIDVPTMSASVKTTMTIAGWALDLRSRDNGPGVDGATVWAYPNPGRGETPIFLGNVAYGQSRPDVAAAFRDGRFVNAGYKLDVMGLALGVYDIVVLPRSTVTGAYEIARVSRVTVEPSVLMTIDSPSANQVVNSGFTISGWALDTRSTTRPGVDVLHVWAFPAAGGGPIFLGVAYTGGSRGDVGAAFGPQYSQGGFTLLSASLASGVYDVVAFAHSDVSGTFENSRVVHVTVR